MVPSHQLGACASTAAHVKQHGRYLESVRRYNYTTPKSYLELISLYKSLLAQKRAELRGEKERLESGVDKISQASAQARACRPARPGLHAPWPIGWPGG